MNFKFISFLLLLIYQNVASIDLDEYFQKSLMKKLRDTKGSFLSVTEVISEFSEDLGRLDEYYSFKENAGSYRMSDHEKHLQEHIYLNDASELYNIQLTGKKSCQTVKLHYNSIHSYKALWAPADILPISDNYGILGPSFLLFTLQDIHEKKLHEIDCKPTLSDEFKDPILCTVILNDKIKVEYNLHTVDDGKYTAVPYKVTVLWRRILKAKDEDNNDDDKGDDDDDHREWKLYKEFHWKSFEQIDDITNFNLPISYGCTRLDHSKFPELNSYYGVKFKIDHQLYFEYRHRKIDYERILQSYRNKMYVDSENSINVVDKVSEMFNMPVRTFYDTTTDVLLDMSLDEDKCYRYHLKEKHNYNFYYMQELFLRGDFFNANSVYKANYIGIFNNDKELTPDYIKEDEIDNTPTIVFEKEITNFNPKLEGEKPKTTNQEYLDTHYPDLNEVYSNHAIISYYFAKDEKHWSRNSSFVVPLKVRVSLFNETDQNGYILYYTKLYEPNAEDHKLLDTSKCAKKMSDRNWFTITFKAPSRQLAEKFVKNYASEIDSNLRKMLTYQIHPSRIGEIIIDLNGDQIYATILLLDLTRTDAYFNEKRGLAFEKPDHGAYIQISKESTEELCSRRCFSQKNCAAYAYSPPLAFESNCRTWLHPRFHDEFNPDKKGKESYDWSRVKLVNHGTSKVGTRLVKYHYKQHKSVENYLKSLERRINLRLFILKLSDKDSNKIIDFNAINIKYELPKKKVYDDIEEDDEDEDAQKETDIMKLRAKNRELKNKNIELKKEVDQLKDEKKKNTHSGHYEINMKNIKLKRKVFRNKLNDDKNENLSNLLNY